MKTSQAINAVGSIPKAIDGPCAWRGSDLAQKSDWIVHWTSAQVVELERAAEHFASTGLALENITPESFPLQNLSSLIGGAIARALAWSWFCDASWFADRKLVDREGCHHLHGHWSPYG